MAFHVRAPLGLFGATLDRAMVSSFASRIGWQPVHIPDMGVRVIKYFQSMKIWIKRQELQTKTSQLSFDFLQLWQSITVTLQRLRNRKDPVLSTIADRKV